MGLEGAQLAWTVHHGLDMYKLIGRYEDKPSEVIDEFDTMREARRMLAEYACAFGDGWSLWILVEGTGGKVGE